MADEETPVTFNIKGSDNAKYVLTLPLSTTVLDLKKKLATAEYADLPADRQRLIYSGRVLKDGDTLETYKVKDGNTLHLVKGAASNQRQNPASQGGPASTATTGTSAGGNVPSNIAAGTGNNPLAGLTGARYAGHVQLPGAGMFGPDGGMGAPPDPDAMIDMLSDPNMQATMNEALQNPQFIDMIIQQQPQLRNNPLARQMFESPEFRRMMTDPASLRAAAQMQRAMGMGGAGGTSAFPAPGVTDTTPGAATGEGNTTTPGQTNTTGSPPPINPFQMFGMPPGGAGNGAANPFAALFGPPPGAQAPGVTPGTGAEGTPGTGANPQAPGSPFQMPDPAALQQMLAAMGGGGLGGPGANPFAALGGMQQPQSPPDNRPPEERYENQLRQLNDMGFYDFDRNVAALRRTGGSVQGAIEHLLSQ